MGFLHNDGLGNRSVKEKQTKRRPSLRKVEDMPFDAESIKNVPRRVKIL
jgi:hypothetical protein